MADVSRFGTLLIPNKTGNSQLEYPIEKTSVLIGRCVIDRDWDSSPENSWGRCLTVGRVGIGGAECSLSHFVTFSCLLLP